MPCHGPRRLRHFNDFECKWKCLIWLHFEKSSFTRCFLDTIFFFVFFFHSSGTTRTRGLWGPRRLANKYGFLIPTAITFSLSCLLCDSKGFSLPWNRFFDYNSIKLILMVSKRAGRLIENSRNRMM